MRIVSLMTLCATVMFLAGCGGGNKAVMPNKTDLAKETGHAEAQNPGELKMNTK